MATPPSSFSFLEWITKHERHGAPTAMETFHPLMEFSVMWSVFERRLCGRYGSWERIAALVKKAVCAGEIVPQDLAPQLTALRAYVLKRNWDANQTVKQLVSNTNQEPEAEAVHALLSVKTEEPPANTVEALMFLAYRVRNNLLHGEKDLYTISQQDELFKSLAFVVGTVIDKVSPQENR